MLDDLDKIPWDRLEHAYGSAADVPGLLRTLASEAPADRERASWELFGNIHHQGTVYEASAAAVPFLARIAIEAEPLTDDERAMIIVLLGAIAGGSSAVVVDQRVIRGGLTPERRSAVERGKAHVQAARDAAARTLPELHRALAGRSAEIDWWLVALASQVPEAGRPLLGLMADLRRTINDANLSAGLGLTMAMIEGRLTVDDLDRAAGFDPDLLPMVDPDGSSTLEHRARIVAHILFERFIPEPATKAVPAVTAKGHASIVGRIRSLIDRWMRGGRADHR